MQRKRRSNTFLPLKKPCTRSLAYLHHSAPPPFPPHTLCSRATASWPLCVRSQCSASGRKEREVARWPGVVLVLVRGKLTPYGLMQREKRDSCPVLSCLVVSGVARRFVQPTVRCNAFNLAPFFVLALPGLRLVSLNSRLPPSLPLLAPSPWSLGLGHCAHFSTTACTGAFTLTVCPYRGLPYRLLLVSLTSSVSPLNTVSSCCSRVFFARSVLLFATTCACNSFLSFRESGRSLAVRACRLCETTHKDWRT